MKRLLLLGSIAALIAACSSRTTSYGSAPAAGGTGGDADGGTSSGGDGSGGKGSSGASSGGIAGKASTGGSAGDASGGTAGSGEAGEGGGVGDCPAKGCGPSCEGLANDCGPNESDNCCVSIAVPASVFPMGRSATVGASDYFEFADQAAADAAADELPEHMASTLAVRIDKYEVTLARFRKFADAAPNSLPAPGDGAHPGIANSGWQAAWDDQLEGLSSIVSCGFQSVWTDPPDPGVDGHLPMNCLSYYVAFAFCAWDGGFLPTEADWEAMAAGGDENRLYPWGAAAPDATRTNFNCELDGNPVCEFTDIPTVGSFPLDVGRWGHLDVGGSMSEWALDAFRADWYETDGSPCDNCASLPEGDLTMSDPRVLRGGSWYWETARHRAAWREEIQARDSLENADFYYGVRCARAL